MSHFHCPLRVAWLAFLTAVYMAGVYMSSSQRVHGNWALPDQFGHGFVVADEILRPA